MKKKTIIREVYRSSNAWDGKDCIVIADPDGEIDRIYPCRVRPAEQLGYCDTLELSAEFFLDIALLQSRGVKIIFRP